MISKFNYRYIPPLLLFLAVLFPFLQLFTNLFEASDKAWRFFLEHELKDCLKNTFFLVSIVGLLSGSIGVSLAWFISIYKFPGRSFFLWALMLPMAIPGYVMGFVFLGLFSYAGPFQTFVREDLSWKNFEIPELNNFFGASVFMSLVLYPYVYLLARNAFLSQGVRCLEVSKSMGYSTFKSFWLVVLPMSRPWLLSAVMLVMMETFADFGLVAQFNFDTFTTVIYSKWYDEQSYSAAAKIATLMIVFVFVLLGFEQITRAKLKFHSLEKNASSSNQIQLFGVKAYLISLYCLVILFFAFILPFGQLIFWSLKAKGFHSGFVADVFQKYLLNSLWLGFLSALIIVVIALIVVSCERNLASKKFRFLMKFSLIGYSVPGTVLAVAVLACVIKFDAYLKEAFESPFLLYGTIFGALFAYLIRFMATSYYTIGGSFERIHKSMEEAASNLGASQWRILWKIYLPLIRPGLLTAFLIALVDIMKEMPIALLSRVPDTLAVKIYEYTSEGEWERAALPGVVLVFIGLIPVIFINKFAQKNN